MSSDLIDRFGERSAAPARAPRDALDALSKVTQQSLQGILAPQHAQKVEAQHVRGSLPNRQHLTIA